MDLQRCCPIYYQLVISIIFILGKNINSIEVKIDNYKAALESLGNVTNHYGYPSYYGRYKRQSSFNKGCKFPNNPPNTTYTILGEPKINYKPGDNVKGLSVLSISCDKGYKLGPFALTISSCVNGEWKESPTSCIHLCPPLKATTSTNVTCRYNRKLLDNCYKPVEGTTATLTCNPLYYEPNVNKIPGYLCTNGRWNPPISSCEPHCGIKRPRSVQNIIGGKAAVPGDYPWQVAVYDDQKEFICGGSIIKQHLVLSAAHCFTDSNGNKMPKEKYLLAAGKYYSKYDEARDLEAQYSMVSEIFIPERYTGDINYQANDIAILSLTKPFTLTQSVQLVCIELISEIVHLDNAAETKNGIVTGWGYITEDKGISKELKEIEIPYIPYQKCFHEVPEQFREFITTDKICGGYLNNSKGVCRGDSGGALVFKDNRYSQQYYVKGIVSSSPATMVLQCDSNQYSVYTSVYAHNEFLKKILTENQINEFIEFTQENAANDEFNPQNHNSGSDLSNKSTLIRCILPTFPTNGKYTIVNQSNSRYNPGEYVPQTSVLSLTCDTTSTISNRELLNDSICSNNGQWIPPPAKCSLCGDSSNRHEMYSWHVGIYNKDKEFVCGGSIIINTKIIISAAQCFTDYDSVTQPAENYLVAAGKHFRKYHDPRDKGAQYSTILQIHIPTTYMGRINYNSVDIAIIILRDPFSLSKVVQPVCLDLNEKSRDLDISIYL